MAEEVGIVRSEFLVKQLSLCPLNCADYRWCSANLFSSWLLFGIINSISTDSSLVKFNES